MIQELKSLIFTASGVALDMVERDLVAGDDQARRDGPSFDAGDDDPVVPAELPGRGDEVARVEGRADELNSGVVVVSRSRLVIAWIPGSSLVTEIRAGPGACTTNAQLGARRSGNCSRHILPARARSSDSRGAFGTIARRAIIRRAILGNELDRPRRARRHGGW